MKHLQKGEKKGMNFGVYVRAKTADEKWATINALDLDATSFRIFVLQRLSNAGIVHSVTGVVPELRTQYTLAELQERKTRYESTQPSNERN